MSTREHPQKRIKNIDGRTVLFMTVCACLVTFLSPNIITHLLFTVLLFALMCWFGVTKQGLGFFGVYLLAIGGLYLQGLYGNLVFPSPLLLSTIYKIILPAMTVSMLMNIPSGKLIASMRKLPIPRKVMLILVVMLRFAPTVIHEFGEVKDAMKVRGFLRSAGTVLRHPLDTAEYAIVPMVFRSLKISDELSASAIVRGIEYPGKKESYYFSRIQVADAVLMVVVGAATAACCFI